MDQVDLNFKAAEKKESRSVYTTDRVTVEHVTIRGPGEWEFSFVGSRHYIAVHNLQFADGETFLDDCPASQKRDLRGLLTFVPAGCCASGWSRASRRLNSFTALHFDPDLIADELERFDSSGLSKPRLYFDCAHAASTIGKLREIVPSLHSGDTLYSETAALLAAIEVNRSLLETPTDERAVGALSKHEAKIVCDYVMDNLDREITLAELAALVHLSKFHFVRAFKRRVGLPPHQFVTRSRMELAKRLLIEETIPLKLVSARVGIRNPSQFSETFRKVVGCSPLWYRRSKR